MVKTLDLSTFVEDNLDSEVLAYAQGACRQNGYCAIAPVEAPEYAA